MRANTRKRTVPVSCRVNTFKCMCHKALLLLFHIWLWHHIKVLKLKRWNFCIQLNLTLPLIYLHKKGRKRSVSANKETDWNPTVPWLCACKMDKKEAFKSLQMFSKLWQWGYISYFSELWTDTPYILDIPFSPTKNVGAVKTICYRNHALKLNFSKRLATPEKISIYDARNWTKAADIYINWHKFVLNFFRFFLLLSVRYVQLGWCGICIRF